MVTKMLPLSLPVELRGYVDEHGHKRFAEWFASLNPPAAAKIAIALTRMEQGNFSNAKSVDAGVHEYKIDFGPGFRIYFGKDGELIVVLIGGGTKQSQQKDIATAQKCWADFKRRKKQDIV